MELSIKGVVHIGGRFFTRLVMPHLELVQGGGGRSSEKWSIATIAMNCSNLLKSM